MAEMHAGQIMARQMKTEGVQYLFTLSGGHISPLYDGFIQEGLGVVDFRHEQAAVHAAEGWAKVTGVPGVAAITAGPGVTDGFTGVVNAYQGGSPCLVIGGKSPMVQWDMGALQELDHNDFMRPVTKLAKTVVDVKRLPEYISMAFRAATSGRPGPAFLEVPFDVIYKNADPEQVWFPQHYKADSVATVDPDSVKQAVQILGSAKRPMVMAGGAIWWDRAWEALRALIETLDCPVYLNGMGRGSIPADHPLFFAVSRKYAIANADAVLVIGTPFDFRLGYGRAPAWPKEQKVIQLDVDAREIGKNRDVTLGLAGNVRAVLTQVVDGLQRRKSRRTDGTWIESVRAAEDKARAADEPYLNSDRTPIHPFRLVRELRDFLDRDATVIGDGGDIVTFGARVINIHQAGHWLDPGALGCLGVGTGYAIAARLARPNQQVMILNGDGSFGLNGMEFETMVRHKLPVVSVIGNDGAWGQNKHPQRKRFGHTIAQELAPGIRYDKLVEALGGYGELVEHPEDIRPALERAFAAGIPACVNVLTDPEVGFGHSGAAAH